jgi:hypothetical protein
MTTAQATTPVTPGDAAAAKPLTASDREALQRQYADDGYVVLPGVLGRERLSALCADISSAHEQQKRAGKLMNGGGGFSGHLNCFPGGQSRFVYQALESLGVLELVKSITPLAFKQPSVRCNFNMPKSVTQHYHIDGVYLDRFTILNVAVMDTDLVNGAIDIIPGTHKRFFPYWRFAVERPYRFAKRIPMQTGDVLIRTSTLWHRGMPNRSPRPRPMLAFTFGDKYERILDDPFVDNDGKIAFYQNWFRPTRLGRLRERTFVAAPITYAAYRFVSSLYSNKGYGTPPA